jgi:hypothetical protein
MSEKKSWEKNCLLEKNSEKKFSEKNRIIFFRTMLVNSAQVNAALYASDQADMLPLDRRLNRKRKEWTKFEDMHILQMVTTNGQKWREVSATMEDRSDDSIRNRWNRLNGMDYKKKEAPDFPSRSLWTKYEDRFILEYVNEHGRNWNKINKVLPHRTAHAIRNRYHRLLSSPQCELTLQYE